MTVKLVEGVVTSGSTVGVGSGVAGSVRSVGATGVVGGVVGGVWVNLTFIGKEPSSSRNKEGKNHRELDYKERVSHKLINFMTKRI